MSESSEQSSLQEMLRLVAQLPDQLEESAGFVPELERLSSPPDRVWLCGMGGSAISGALLGACSDLGLPELRLHRGYGLPGAGLHGYFVFSSYSGETEEVISAYDAWSARGEKGGAIVISSGGELATRADADGVPVLRLPGGLPPRAALGWGLGALLLGLERLGMAEGIEEPLGEAVELLRARASLLGPEADATANPARRIARLLYGKLVLLYAGCAISNAIAWRWKAQINENAKALAYVSAFPEHNHNEITGFVAESGLPGNCFVVGLRDHSEHPRVHRRFDAAREILGERIHAFEEFRSEGRSDLARLLSLVQLGDHASLYLAEAYGVDPMSIEAIDRLKDSLRD